MPNNDFLPDTDAGLRAFCVNFSTLLNAAPTDYGYTIEAAKEYEDLVTVYSTKLQTSLDPMTEGKMATFLKNEAKKTLAARTRVMARQIDNLETVNDEQRKALGLTIRDTTRTRTPAPTMAPYVVVKGTRGRTVILEVRGDAFKRGKPAGVAQSTILTHVGNALPKTTREWNFALNATRSTVEVDFGPSETGGKVWITAFWSNRAGESGPSARPVDVDLPAGGATATKEGEETTPMRLAA